MLNRIEWKERGDGNANGQWERERYEKHHKYTERGEKIDVF